MALQTMKGHLKLKSHSPPSPQQVASPSPRPVAQVCSRNESEEGEREGESSSPRPFTSPPVLSVTTMPCSAVTLSLATITAIVATALLAIAFSTDNWVHIDVKRSNIKLTFSAGFARSSKKAPLNELALAAAALEETC
ncbi:hypothetical protein J6590_039488 [Homalodisca vitripennis]|nr:hypothetical protein J6590_039488 [Homalodisca vitripennis]